MTLIRSNSRASAFSDEFSALAESDNTSHNNDEEDWNDDLEGDLDLTRIGMLSNDERMIVVPLGGSASEHSRMAKSPSRKPESAATTARQRTSPGRPRPTAVHTRSTNSTKTLIRPGQHP